MSCKTSDNSTSVLMRTLPPSRRGREECLEPVLGHVIGTFQHTDKAADGEEATAEWLLGTVCRVLCCDSCCTLDCLPPVTNLLCLICSFSKHEMLFIPYLLQSTLYFPTV